MHFVVVTNASAKKAREAALQLEQMRAVFHAAFPATTDDSAAPITVLALKDKKSFQSLEPTDYIGRGKLDLAGYFLQTDGRNYILLRLDAEGEHPYATVYHEYTHYMLRGDAAWLPLWLNEGLAEFYQNTEIESKEVHLGAPSEDNIIFLRLHSLLPLTTLLQVDHSSPYYHEEAKGTIFYAESWALTHYLMLNDGVHKTHRVQDYANLLMQHQDSVTAARNAFGDLNQLQKHLNSYVERSVFEMYTLPATVVIDKSALSLRPISVNDVNAMRGAVLLANGRTQEGQALLDTVLRDDPKNALVYETIGFARFRAGDLAGARESFGKAVQLNSDSYLVNYDYATLAMNAGDSGQDPLIESSLRAAIKLNPAYAPPYDALATLYARKHERFDEAHRLNVMAVALAPDNLGYRIHTAEVLVAAGQLDSALGVLNLAAKFAKSSSDMESVQIRIDQIEQAQAAQQQAKEDSVKSPEPSSPVLPASNVTAPPGIGTKLIIKFKYPIGAPTGPHHTVRGVVRNVQCYYPSVITFTVEGAGKPVFLYSNDFFHIPFKAANYTPQGELHPCTAIQGMKARVEYGEVSDKSVDGQVISVLLSR